VPGNRSGHLGRMMHNKLVGWVERSESHLASPKNRVVTSTRQSARASGPIQRRVRAIVSTKVFRSINSDVDYSPDCPLPLPECIRAVLSRDFASAA
jgi:hypothetical protein